MGTSDTISEHPAGSFPQGQRRDFRKLAAIPSNIFAWLMWRLERRQSRLALLELTDEQLKDICLSRADAYREGTRSFLD
jgi:uncharacterized protein YjiS (DUF1127 family)